MPDGDDVDQPLPDHLVREPEQPLGLVVRERDPSAHVCRHRALADPVQHGLALLEQRRDLLGLEAERLALHAPGDERRAAGAEQERDRGRDQEHRQDREELVADVPLEHADGDHADDPSVRVAERYLRARRPPEAQLRVPRGGHFP